ncbi:MAG: phospholipase D-like domain-containing protein [Candidatus Limnocylindrales bacterium]
MSRRRWLAAGAGAAASGAYLARRARRHVAYPPGPDAITAAGSAARAAELAAMPRVRRSDLAMSFAPSIATSVDPLLHGRSYFPRMLEDIGAAKDHIHLLIYGYKPGDIGTTFLDALRAKTAQGVQVRLEVDAIGSEVEMGSKQLFRDLREAGVEIVANYALGPVRTGELGSRRAALRLEDTLHFDHRKMAVIDGRVGYVGGSGIEDHYNDERFYDVMCRVTGPVVAQLQLVFLASWRHHDGSLPDDPAEFARFFPADALIVPDDAPLHAPTTLLWNVPGTGHHPISDAIEQSLEAATDRIDVVNPYISNRAILERVHAAAARGVKVRLIAPGKPTPPQPAAAFRHYYERLLDSGVEILLHPEMAHAKVLRIDDRVLIGGCNLDDLSLFRNDELDLLFDDPAVVTLTEQAVFDVLAQMSTPATVPTGTRERAWNATMARLSRLL